jgi:transposase-like protein
MAKAWRCGTTGTYVTRTGSKFGRKLEQAVTALLTQRNVEEAAKAVGIAPRTLLRWMKEPEFQGAYREAKRNAYSHAVGRLQQGATAAATTLLKVMLDPSTPASVRVRAAECVMNQSSKAIEIEDVEARVAELERSAESARERGLT